MTKDQIQAQLQYITTVSAIDKETATNLEVQLYENLVEAIATGQYDKVSFLEVKALCKLVLSVQDINFRRNYS